MKEKNSIKNTMSKGEFMMDKNSMTENIRNLQLYTLANFMESIMYHSIGESWKEKVIAKARIKYLNDDHRSNYAKFIKIIRCQKNNNESFEIEDLDVTAVTTILLQDFFNECFKDNNKKEYREMIKRIRNDRNSLSHISFSDNRYEIYTSSIENIENFIIFLENNEWKYEASIEFEEYLKKHGKRFGEISFLDKIKETISNYKIDAEQLFTKNIMRNIRHVEIKFTTGKDEIIGEVSCRIELIADPAYVHDVKTIQNRISLSLPSGAYRLICLAVPNGYKKFITREFYVSISKNDLNLEIPIETLKNIDYNSTKVEISIKDKEGKILPNFKIKLSSKDNKYQKIFITKNEEYILNLIKGEYIIECLECPSEFYLFDKNRLFLCGNEKKEKRSIMVYRKQYEKHDKKANVEINIVNDDGKYIAGLILELFNEQNTKRAFYSYTTKNESTNISLKRGHYLLIINDGCEYKEKIRFEVTGQEKQVIKFKIKNKKTKNAQPSNNFNDSSMWHKTNIKNSNYVISLEKLINDHQIDIDNNTNLLREGEDYFYGRGVEKNYIKAVEYFKKAADNDNIYAQNYLGMCYEYGLGLEVDLNIAFQYYEYASKQGNIEAIANLGDMYFEGKGVEKNYIKAVECFKKAADNDNAYAQNYLGMCYENGIGVEFNLKNAFEFYKKAAEFENSESEFKIGLFYDKGYYVNCDVKEAMKWFKKSADHGYAKAKAVLGYYYLIGKGVEKNEEKAYKYTYDAAKQGHIVSIRNLGVFYEDGIFIEKDFDKAEKYYNLALESGDVQAKKFLEDLKLKRYNDEKNIAYENKYQSISECKLKATSGSIEAQYTLGECYEKGNGVDKNIIEAAYWYRRAAKQKCQKARKNLQRLVTEYPSLHCSDDPICLADYIISSIFTNNPIYQYRVGEFYEHGVDVEKNIVEAFEWYRKAAKQKYHLAEKACDRLLKDYPYKIKFRKGFFKKTI